MLLTTKYVLSRMLLYSLVLISVPPKAPLSSSTTKVTACTKAESSRTIVFEVHPFALPRRLDFAGQGHDYHRKVKNWIIGGVSR